MSDNATRPAIMVTGHRPNKLFGYQNQAAYNTMCQDLANLVATEIAPAIDPNHVGITAISGGAQGADQTFFWAMDALKRQSVAVIENVVFAPFPAQDSRWAEHGLFGKTQYRTMIETADAVRYTNPGTDLATREVMAALMQRNQDMVDAATACIAVHLSSEPDPFTTNAKGGTANAMRRARAKGLPLWIYDPISRAAKKVA